MATGSELAARASSDGGTGLRVGLVKLGAIGDVVNSLPFVNRLRDAWPRADIAWCIAPLAHGLVRGHRAIDRFHVLDLPRLASLPGIVRTLRGARFDLVIDLQRIAKSGLLTRLTGAPHRLGFDRARCKEASWIFLTERIAPNPRPGVTVAQYLEFADHLGLPPGEPRWDLPLVPFERAPDGRPLIVVNPGASKEANRWPTASWAALCRRLTDEFDARLVVTGGPGDRELAAEVERLAGVTLEDTCGRLDLQQSAGLFAAADLFVGGDTGPLHMAVAVGTPVVALFGAADPERTGPFGQADAVVRHLVPCAPCKKRHCTVAGHPCMTELSIEPVFAKVRARLAELAANGGPALRGATLEPRPRTIGDRAKESTPGS